MKNAKYYRFIAYKSTWLLRKKIKKIEKIIKKKSSEGFLFVDIPDVSDSYILSYFEKLGFETKTDTKNNITITRFMWAR